MTTERIIADTITGKSPVDAEHCPVPPAEWGPGVMVRDVARRCWRWTPLPAPWTQPPPTAARPILEMYWLDHHTQWRDATARLRLATDSVEIGGRRTRALSIRIGLCPGDAWDQPRDRESPGEIVVVDDQIEYLRDALTAMLERTEDP